MVVASMLNPVKKFSTGGILVRSNSRTTTVSVPSGLDWVSRRRLLSVAIGWLLCLTDRTKVNAFMPTMVQTVTQSSTVRILRVALVVSFISVKFTRVTEEQVTRCPTLCRLTFVTEFRNTDTSVTVVMTRA